jgi:hypothetical protein
MDHGRIIYYNGAYWHVHRLPVLPKPFSYVVQGTKLGGICGFRP